MKKLFSPKHFFVRHRNLISDSSLVFFAQAITALSVFLLTSALANALSPEQFGAYRYLYALIGILIISSLPGIDTAVTRAVATGAHLSPSRISLYKIRWSLLGSAVLGACSVYYFYHNNALLGSLTATAGLLLPFLQSFQSIIFVLQGQRSFLLASSLQSIAVVVPVLLTLLALLYTTDVVVLFIFFAASSALTQLIVLVVFRPKTFTEKLDFETASYGKSLTLLSCVNVAAQHIDKLIVWYFFGAAETALYTIATLIPTEIQRNGRMFGQVILPRLAQQEQQMSFRTWLEKGLIAVSMLFFLALLYIGASSTIFTSFFPKYLSALPYTAVAIFMIVSIPIFVIRSFFMAQKALAELRTTLYIGPLLKTICLFLGAAFAGLWGLVIGLVVGNLLELLFNVQQLHHFLRKAESTPTISPRK